MKVLRVLVLLTVLSLIIFSTQADAATIYASGNAGTSLITIDTGTGVGTVVGPTGVIGAYPTAFNPYGTLYTVTEGYSDGSNSYLGTFNLGTGAVTTIGDPFDIPHITSLEFSPDGTLYGGSFNGPQTPDPPGFDGTSYLYTIDTTTGAATQIGDELGFDAVMDFAFDSSGTMWAVNGGPVATSDLYTIDLDSGSATYVSTIEVPTVHDGWIMGIMFDSDDILYATNNWESGVEGGGTSKLYTVDTESGAATLVGDTGINQAHGGDIGVVPEPISSTLFLVGGIALGFRRMRKKVQ